TAFWIVLALLFALGIYVWRGPVDGVSFLTGYVIEKSLSVDNIFVFILMFSFFRVDPRYQHKVLFWGILGALVMRAVFIFAGITLIQKFHWVIYLFGAFLIYTGIRMAFHRETEIHPEKNPVLRIFRRFVPVTEDYRDDRFFVRENARRLATPLFIVLLFIETTDIVFAVDSIPAVIAITRNPFIVYTSNVFAILGLRALYFALAGTMKIFRFLHYGLSVILAFIGTKMLISDIYEMPVVIALGVVAGILAISVLASVFKPPRAE
ncbi:MAG: TerC family protein, partial [Bacteroidetes bacterium]|nr:TerC family protein [Bacteroidota bacterium]